jgi:HAD superfamily hydrolase (TIGR01549 family)
LIIVPDKRIKAILFDLGETLLSFGQVNTARLFRQGAKASYKFLQDAGQPVGNFRYYCWRNLMALRVRYWISNISGIDFDALALLKSINTKIGVGLNEQQWQHLAWLWYEPLSKVGRIETKTAETLAALKNLGLKLGILSNTFINSSSLEKHLDQLGVLDYFSVRLYSYEFNFRKPDTRIFKAAAHRIGETLENILFVGDRIDKDIRPALKAGMAAVLKAAYTNIGKKIPKGVWQINLLSELPALVKKIDKERGS